MLYRPAYSCHPDIQSKRFQLPIANVTNLILANYGLL